MRGFLRARLQHSERAVYAGCRSVMGQVQGLLCVAVRGIMLMREAAWCIGKTPDD